MRIVLGNDFYCDIDQLNHTLKKIFYVEPYEKKGKVIEGHTSEKVIGYYKDFEQMAEALIKYRQKDVPADVVMTIQEHAEFIRITNNFTLERFKSNGEILMKEGE